MISIKNVSKSFGKKEAVKDLSWNLESGKITGFIGPNGAGKTTTLRMITGILEPDEGSIEINGHDIVRDPIRAKEEFGYISDNPDLFTALKGIEYVNFICDIYKVSSKDREERLKGLVDSFEMAESMGDKISSYSHGMRQKIHIIACLMHDPNVWIMDEPMTGLDPQSSFLLKKKMKEHASKGNTVLFSTHVLEVAEKLCDTIAIINKGEMKYIGTLEELRDQYPERSLEEIFLLVTGSKILDEDSKESETSSREGADVEEGELR